MEAGTALHLALDELESVDLTFDHAVAPRQLQGGQNRIPVATKMPGEGGQRRMLCGFDPPFPCQGVSRADHIEEQFR